MTISTLQQITEVTEVDSVTISEIVQDSEGLFVREIRTYGPDDGGGTRPLLFTLRLSGATADKVTLNAPAQTF